MEAAHAAMALSGDPRLTIAARVPSPPWPVRVEIPVEEARLWTPEDPYVHTLRIEWKWRGAAARTVEAGRIEWPVPIDAKPGYSLWVELFDASGKWLYTNNCHFDVARASRPGVLKVRASHEGRPLEGAYAVLSGVRIPIYRDPGLLLALPEGAYSLHFRAEGFKDISRQIAIEPGKANEVALEFAK